MDLKIKVKAIDGSYIKVWLELPDLGITITDIRFHRTTCCIQLPEVVHFGSKMLEDLKKAIFDKIASITKEMD